MKKYSFAIVFLILFSFPFFAETKTIATMYKTRLTYQDMIEIFMDEFNKPQFYRNMVWYYKVYNEENRQYNDWSVQTRNDGYKTKDGEQVKEFSVILNMDNGYFESCSYSKPTTHFNKNTFFIDDKDEALKCFKNKESTLAAFIEESCKWKKRWQCRKSWTMEQFNAIDTYINKSIDKDKHLWSFLIDNNCGQAIETYINAGADTEDENGGKIFGKDSFWDGSPLIMAAAKGNIDIVKILIENGADINKEFGDFHTTALGAACSEKQIDIAKYLIEHGSNLYDILIVRTNDYSLVKLALDKGMNPNCLRWTEDPFVIDLLFKSGANDINEKRDYLNNYVTALFVNADCGNFYAVKSLLEHGADITIKDSNLDSVLSFISKCQYSFDLPQNTIKIMDLLLEAGININDKNIQGESAIFSPIIDKNVFCFDKTSEYYDENEQYRVNAKKSSKSIIEYLIQKGADVNLQNNDGNTPLMKACSFNENSEAVMAFLLAGADTSIKNNNGETALDIATRNNCTDIIPLLQLAQKNTR